MGCVATLLLALPAQAQAAVNCSDFATQAGAQNYYESVGGPGQDPEGLDADHDGIACETLPCPCRSLSPDTDGDGWVDQYDACPTVAARTTNGCPLPPLPPLPPPPPPPPADTDHDGVVDSADACPTVAAATPNGCPLAVPPPLTVYAGRFDLGDGDYSPLGTPQRKPPRVWPFSADARTSVVGVRWRRWGESEAIGTGTARVSDCRPTCGRGHIARYPGARVVLYRRLQGDCRQERAVFYTRARFSWQAKSRLRKVTAKLVAGCGQT
jgi:hypothetical protein